MSLAGGFARPEAWPLLLLVPAAVGAGLAFERARMRRLRRAVGPRLERLAPDASPIMRRTRGALLAGALLFAAVALLDPRFGEGPRELEQRGIDVVVCLDVSRSMRARDLPPDRLEHAKAELERLVQASRGDRFALVLFAGEARLAVPLTRDADSFLDRVRRAEPLDVAVPGTDLGAALEVALAALGEPSGEHEAVLLLSDGEDHEARGRAAAEALAARGVAVSAVGFGTPWGAKVPLSADPSAKFLTDREGREVVSALDAGGLLSIAAATGGTFVDASVVARPLDEVRTDVLSRLERKAFSAARATELRARFQWPLGAALVLLLLALANAGRARTRTRHRIARTPARPAVALAALLLPAALAGAIAASVDGARAWREGRFAEAHAAFAAAAREAGDAADASLFVDEALAALRAGRLREAEVAAERAAARGGRPLEPLRDFLLGNAAYERAARARAQAEGPEAEPFAFDLALSEAEEALAAWSRAAGSRPDWPEARRNVERALLLRDDLRALRDEARRRAEERRKKDRAPEDDPDRAEPATDERAPTGRPQGFDDAPDLERRLLERLAAKEREKRAIREGARASRAAESERDW